MDSDAVPFPNPDQRGRSLEALLVALVSGAEADSSEVMALGGDLACLARVLDVSMLKFQERDAIIESLHKYRSTVEYDMVKAWDARGRKWYGDRFDFKRNMVGTLVLELHHAMHLPMWPTNGILFPSSD